MCAECEHACCIHESVLRRWGHVQGGAECTVEYERECGSCGVANPVRRWQVCSGGLCRYEALVAVPDEAATVPSTSRKGSDSGVVCTEDRLEQETTELAADKHAMDHNLQKMVVHCPQKKIRLVIRLFESAWDKRIARPDLLVMHCHDVQFRLHCRARCNQHLC